MRWLNGDKCVPNADWQADMFDAFQIDTELIGDTIQQGFGSGIAVAVLDPTSEYGELYGLEASLIPNAKSARKIEFAAGRFAARMAMTAMGLPAQPVLCGSDRAPIWPKGMVGSLTHSSNCCAVALTQASQFRAVGLDVEHDDPLSDADQAEVLTRFEKNWLLARPKSERGVLAKVIFSAKESVYKAQYPLTKQVIGFDAVDVALDTGNGRFAARFSQDVGAIAKDSSVSGWFRQLEGSVVTGLTIS